MPYLGNQHNVGDHVNNFKVLDDISSHTATFDGSATSVVDTTNNTIRVPLHRFIQGQRVTYTNGGGGNIGGLTTGTAYFVSFDSANTIKLATTLANANSNTVINLSAVGSGTSHTLNAAFDGINTKFKMTHSSGKAARLNNATQINVAINNVIQRPNLDPNNFNDGFALQDNHKIVFKTAPTVNDIFWGSIIANTIENFDLRDNEVDNFTGDGSTTEFTLSTIPANNESVIVSINGVVQHPSDKNTARSYKLINSIIQFTAAPALNDEIQVRHIGFAGASTNDVSGFYGRTGNVALTADDHITTGDITSRNVNASGIVTASTFDGAFTGNVVGTSATFTGNLTVGGVLTYEDVTNVDSVGIITAQKDIHVGAGVSAVGVGTFGSLDIGGDIDVDGHTNLDNVSIAGVTTTSGNITIENAEPSLFLTDTNGNPDYKIFNDSGALKIYDTTYSATRLQIGPTNGEVTVQSNTNFPNGITMNPGTASVVNTIAQRLGDTDTKIRFPANDTFTAETGGSERLKIQNSGVIITGVTSITASAHVSNANGSVFFGAGNATAYGSQGGIGRASNANYHIGSSAPGDLCIAAEGSKRILFGTKTGTGIGGITKRMSIASNGTVTIDGNLDAIGGIDATANSTFAGDIDVDGHTNLDNVSVAGITTFSGIVDATNTPASIRVAQDIQHKGDADTKITFPANDTISFDTAGSEALRITQGGKLGINHGSPVTIIHAVGNNTVGTSVTMTLQSHDTANATAGIDLLARNNSNVNQTSKILATSGGTNNVDLTFHTNNTEKLRITSAGQLGVGESAPTFAAINSISANAARGIEIYKDGADTGSAIKLAGDNGSGNKAYSQLGYSGANATAHWANYNTSGTLQGEIVIGSTGKIGIGTDIPTYKLHVDSDDAAIGLWKSRRSSGSYIDYSVGANGAALGFIGAGGQILTGGADSGDFAIRSQGDLCFASGGSTERVRIDTGGNLHIKGTDHATRYYRDDGARYGSIFYNGSHFVIRQPTGDNLQIEKFDGTILHRFNTAGDLSVGHDSPQRKLHVKSGANNNNGAFRIESAPGNIMDMGTDSSMHFLNCVNNDPFRIKFAGNEALRLTHETSGNGSTTLQFYMVTNNSQGATPYIKGVCGTEAGGSDSDNAGGFEFHTKTGGSGTDINAMKIDHNGRVSIGAHNTHNPTAALHIIADTQGTNTALQVGQNGSERYFRINEIPSQANFLECLLSFYDNSLANVLKLQNTYAGLANMGTAIQFVGHGGSQTGRIAVKNRDANSASNSIMELESSYILKPSVPSFHAYHVSGTQSSVITFNNTWHNIGNHFNAGNGTFTCPVSGRYLFCFAFLHSSSPTSYARVTFRINGSHNTRYGDTLCDDTGLYINTSMSMVFNLSINDTVQLYCEGNHIYGQPNSIYGAFSGYLLG